MADNTIIQQGYFTSDGTDKIIPLRSDVDWVEVQNLTNIAAGVQWTGQTWFWQRGMNNNDAIVDFHAAASQVISRSTCAVGFNGAVYRGISLLDTSTATVGAALAVTAGTNATQPVYSTANTGVLIPGSIVRLASTAQLTLNGLDFSVDTIVLNTSFRLANTLATAPGVVAGANGFYRFVAYNVSTYDRIYPKNRVISNISQANPGIVRTLVDHNYVTGQKVRLKVPAANGMVELNNVVCTVTNINASTFSIGIDTTGYTAFVFPLSLAANVPFTPAEVVPMAVDGLQMNNPLFEAQDKDTINIVLGTSATAAIALASPGGTNGDVIKWRAGKSFAYNV